MLELPEWAASLHNGYNNPPRNFSEMGERLRAAWQPVNDALKQLGHAFVAGYQKGTREAKEEKK